MTKTIKAPTASVLRGIDIVLRMAAVSAAYPANMKANRDMVAAGTWLGALIGKPVMAAGRRTR